MFSSFFGKKETVISDAEPEAKAKPIAKDVASTVATEVKVSAATPQLAELGSNFGQYNAMPVLVLNLTCEMMYTLSQRLTAQNIESSKASKVLADVIKAAFSSLFISELMKPQTMYTTSAVRQIFDRLAHSSIMRLNATSMNKLYDLMRMLFKRQLLLCASPDHILQVTLTHMEAMKGLVAGDTKAIELINEAIEQVMVKYEHCSSAQWMQLQEELLKFFQNTKIKISLLLEEKAQSRETGMIHLCNEGRLPYGAELPGQVRYYSGGAVASTEVLQHPLQGKCTVASTALDPTWAVGCSVYTDKRLGNEAVQQTFEQLPPTFQRAEAALMEMHQRQRSGQTAALVLSDKALLNRALQQGSKMWRRSKLSLLGQGRAGKTAMANSLAGRDFEETASTVGINQLTCDVKQVKVGEEQEWGECAKSGGREFELALAQLVARNKRLAKEKAAASSGTAAVGQGKAQESGGGILAYMQTVLGLGSEGQEGERLGLEEEVEGEGEGAEQSASAESTKEPAGAGEARGGANISAKDTSNGEAAEHVDYDLHVEEHTDTHESTAAVTPAGARAGGKDPAPSSSSPLDEEMVMKMLATMEDADSGLLISLFDFGGQSVFDVIHHLFLTRNGVYALVFNMEWLVSDGPDRDRALSYMRKWLSSIAVHTYNKVTRTTAPIVIVGTRLDTVTSAAQHAQISTLLHEQFSDNLAWRSVVGNDEGRDSDGRAFQWFFPVDNKLGKRGASMRRLMKVVREVIDGADYTHKEVPLTWFKAIDQMSDTKKDCLALPEVAVIGEACGVTGPEVTFLLAFLHDMGHLMWLDEPGLRDVVILDPVSYLVTPATVVICKITPDNDDPTHHFMACHRECERLHKREWMQLKHDGVLNVALLPILWKPYLDHQAVLLQLMVKFGLLVPLRSSTAPASPSKAAGGGAPPAITAPAVSQYLVPTLLSPAPTQGHTAVDWTDAPYCTCYLVFTLLEDLQHSTVLTAADLQSAGFLPGGMFERLVGKALSWSQDTARGSSINLQSVLLHKDLAILSFGQQRFRLVHCADIHCVKVEVEGSNPLGIQQKLQDFVGRIIEECMRSLRCFTAVLYSASTGTSAETRDPLGKALLPSELLIPLSQLRQAAKGESMLAWRGGRSLLNTHQVKTQYASWLRLHELREKYDLFISYRWNQHDSKFTEQLFDMFTNYSVGAELRAVEVFLDKKRLQEGRMFKLDFACALTHALVALPVVSVDAIQRMLEHTSSSAVDNVLLEWVMILESFAAGRLKKVYPVLFGRRIPVSLQLEGGNAGGGGDGAGYRVTDFFAEGMYNMLPKVTPTATLAQAAELLQANGIQPSEKMQSYTVHSVVQELLQFLLCKASDFTAAELTEAFAERAVRLLGDCGQQALDEVSGRAQPASTVPAQTAAPAAAVAADTPGKQAATDGGAAGKRQLRDLSVQELQALLEREGFQKAMAPLLGNGVGGKQLWFCEEYGDLLGEDFGLTSKPLARELMEAVTRWKAEGVDVH